MWLFFADLWEILLNSICSSLYSFNDIYGVNQAGVAGGVIFSTDAPSTYVHCQDSDTPINNTHCPEWFQGNFNALIPMSSGFQYGPGMAFPAQNVTLGLGSTPNETIKYISDGSPLLLPPVHLVDQAGQIVKLPGLQAALNVTNVTALPAGANNATLPNQIYAQANWSGYFIFTDAVLVGVPIIYNLTIAVPEVWP